MFECFSVMNDYNSGDEQANVSSANFTVEVGNFKEFIVQIGS